MELAIRLVRAVMRSASVETISPRHWWDRAKAALETAASAAEGWPDLVSRMCRKLQISVPNDYTASSVFGIGREVGRHFQTFCKIAERDAIYIVAMARAENQADRDEWRNNNA